ncbi:MAG: hypothetical protein WBC71_07115 [Salaquimonas sp.]
MSLIFFVMASGFVAAGLLNAVHITLQNAIDEPPANGMALYFHSPPAIAWSMFVCTFAGPYLVLSQSLHFWKQGHLPFPVLALCMFLSLIWSFCSGVFIVESAIALGLAKA